MHFGASELDPCAVALDHLRRLVRGLRLSAQAAERTVALSGAQLFVLRTVADAPGSSIARIAELTLTDPSSVSVVVARLVARGLLVRHRDRADGRRAVLTLAPKGRAWLARAPEPVQVQLVAALRAMPERRVRAANAVLAKLVQTVGAGPAAAPMFFEESPRAVRRGRA